MNIIRKNKKSLAIVLIILISSACSHQPRQKTVVTVKPAFSNIADFKEVNYSDFEFSDAQRKAFVETILPKLNGGTLTKNEIDLEYLYTKIKSQEDLPYINQSKFNANLINGFNNQMSTVSSDELKWIFIKYLPYQASDKFHYILFRLDGAEGIQYMSLKIRKVGDSFKIADLHNYNTNFLFSYTIGRFMALSYKASKLSQFDPQSKVFEVFSNFSRALAVNDYEEMEKWFNLLPETYKYEPVIQNRRLVTAQISGQENYHLVLEDVYKRFKNNDQFNYYLIDYYIYKEDFHGAIALFKEQSALFDGDNEIDVFIASLYFLGKDYQAALNEVKSIVIKSPDEERAYWLALSCLANLDRHHEMLVVLDILKHTFQYNINSEFFDEEVYYISFKNSKAYTIWQSKNEV